MRLQVGDRAPAFSALDQAGKRHTLADYEGSRLLLYFYPKDDTPGCTKEACGFRDLFAAQKGSIVVLGVSKDSVESHAAFAAKFALPFPLLADVDRAVAAAYGADGVTFPKRVSFLIHPSGAIEKIYDTIDCDTHAMEVLNDVAQNAS